MGNSSASARATAQRHRYGVLPPQLGRGSGNNIAHLPIASTLAIPAELSEWRAEGGIHRVVSLSHDGSVMLADYSRSAHARPKRFPSVGDALTHIKRSRAQKGKGTSTTLRS